jgi:molecular chaperone DnaK
MGEKIDAGTRQNIESHIEKLRTVMDGEDRDAIQREIDQLMQASHKLAEEMYKQTSGQQAGADQAGGSQQQDAGGQKRSDEDIVDADFEEVKKDK